MGTTRKQRGINRIVVGVWDFEAGKRFYGDLLDATWQINPEGDAEAWGVQVAMAFDAGIELVSPIEGKDSAARTTMEANGEGILGVVFAVEDADASLAAANEAGIDAFFTLDYSQDEIDRKLAGKFTRYYEHFLAAKPPLSGSVLLGEFIDRE
ncbi:MAG: hypothetical protein HKN26_02450 [Acidimicrobiales bacterium]|nr:hypothetical protein [Acidimicrobiales bacterium]